MEQSEFELDFTRAGDDADSTYRVRARTTRASAQGEFQLPSSTDLDEQLSVVETLVAISSGDMVQRSRETKLEIPVRRFGKQLSAYVFTPAIRSLYQQTVEHARHNDGHVSIVIRVNDQTIQRLPWELMWDEVAGDYFALRTPIIRTAPSAVITADTLVTDSQLRVLVVAANPSDFPYLDIDKERTRLEHAVAPLVDSGRMALTWLDGDRHIDLQNALRGPQRWHMLHFIGHGGFDEHKDEGYIALVRDEATTADHVTATELNRLLAAQDKLRLVVLNACETGRAAIDNFYASTAAALVNNGVAAVVAMQYPITDGAAAEFAKMLYADIAAYQPLDQAVLGARVSLARYTPTTMEWATPVLYLQNSDARLFQPSLETAFVAPPPGPAEDFLSQATDAVSAQHYDYALGLLRDNQNQWSIHPGAVKELLVRISDAHRADNRMAAALEVLELAATTVGPNESIHHLLSEVAQDQAKNRALAAELVSTADAQIDRGEWEAALESLDEAGRLDPDSPVVRSRRLLLADRQNTQYLITEIHAARSAGDWSRVFELVEKERAVRGITPDRLANLLNEHQLTLTRLTAEARAGLFRQNRLPAEERLVLRHPARVTQVAFSPNGSKIVTCAGDGRIRAWWLSDGGLIQNESGYRPDSPMRQVAMDLDDSRIYNMWDNLVYSWLVFDSRHQTEINIGARVSCVSSALTDLVGVATDRQVEIWDFAARVRRYVGYRHDASITDIHFTGPIRELLVTCDTLGRLLLWSVPDDELLLSRMLPAVAYHTASDNDGRCVAALAGNRIEYTPNIEAGSPFRTLAGDANRQATAVDVSTDGRFILAGFTDRTISIFDTTDGECVKTLRLNGTALDVSFAPDGFGFAAACDDGTTRVYRLDHGSPDSDPTRARQ